MALYLGVQYPFHANKQLSMQISDCISYIPGNNFLDSRKAREIPFFTHQNQNFIQGIDNFCTTKRNEGELTEFHPYWPQTVNMDTMFSWATFAKISAPLVNTFLNHLMSRHVAFLKLLV